MVSLHLLSLMGLFALSSLSFAAALLIEWRAPLTAPAAPSPASPALAPSKVAGSAELRRDLFHAGFDHPQAASYFTLAKAISGAVGLGLGLICILSFDMFARMSPPGKIGLLVLTGALGYYLPMRAVAVRQAGYLRRIALALPDALDFMLVSVEAGQSADLAVMRVSEELAPVHPELAAQFGTLTEALAAGASREDAWHRMAQDCGNDDLRQLASIVVQSSTMGTPVAQTLRVFAADLRDQHVRKVEEKANLLPTKMTLGTMIFTIPPLLLMLLSPAVYKIMQTF